MSLSNLYEGKLADHLFGIAAMTAPAMWIALSIGDPGEDGSGLSEPSGGAYARISFSDWVRATGTSVVNNDSDIQFAEATADWGICTHYAPMDAETGGDVIMSFPLDTSLDVKIGNRVTFHANNASVTMD